MTVAPRRPYARPPTWPEPILWEPMPAAPDGWHWTATTIAAVALATPGTWHLHVTGNAATTAHRLRARGFDAVSYRHQLLYVRYRPEGDTDAP